MVIHGGVCNNHKIKLLFGTNHISQLSVACSSEGTYEKDFLGIPKESLQNFGKILEVNILVPVSTINS